MTALYDRPHLPAIDLYEMLLLALPILQLRYSCIADVRAYSEHYTYQTSFKKYNDTLWVFFNYYPNARQGHRWSVSHEGKIGKPWRDTPLFKKKVSKRFASLLDAITYYEKEIKR